MANVRKSGLGPLLPQDLQDELKNRLRKTGSSTSTRNLDEVGVNSRLKLSNLNTAGVGATSVGTVEHSDAISLVRNLSHLSEGVGRDPADMDAAKHYSANLSSERKSANGHETDDIIQNSPIMRKYKMGEG